MILENVLNNMRKSIPNNKNIVFVGIGTDRVIFDMIGCFTCTLLEMCNYNVLGTINKPIHALNCNEWSEYINDNYNEDYVIIGIDSAVSHKDNKNKEKYVKFRKGGVKPGAGLGKCLNEIGNYSIVGIVGHSDNMSDIKNMRFNDIYNMCEDIVDTINEFMKTYR